MTEFEELSIRFKERIIKQSEYVPEAREKLQETNEQQLQILRQLATALEPKNQQQTIPMAILSWKQLKAPERTYRVSVAVDGNMAYYVVKWVRLNCSLQLQLTRGRVGNRAELHFQVPVLS